MGQRKQFIQDFILGGLMIYHSFTLDQKCFFFFNKLAFFVERNGKWLIIKGVK